MLPKIFQRAYRAYGHDIGINQWRHDLKEYSEYPALVKYIRFLFFKNFQGMFQIFLDSFATAGKFLTAEGIV